MDVVKGNKGSKGRTIAAAALRRAARRRRAGLLELLFGRVHC